MVSGCDATGKITTDIEMYDKTAKKWKRIDSLSFARSRAAAAVINNNVIVVIGGYTKRGSVSDRKSSSLTVVQGRRKQI